MSKRKPARQPPSGSGASLTSTAPIFRSIKVGASLVNWLKVEAARRGIPMYQLLDELVARGCFAERNSGHRREPSSVRAGELRCVVGEFRPWRPVADGERG